MLFSYRSLRRHEPITREEYSDDGIRDSERVDGGAELVRRGVPAIRRGSEQPTHLLPL
jgi:hypothetical protein